MAEDTAEYDLSNREIALYRITMYLKRIEIHIVARNSGFLVFKDLKPLQRHDQVLHAL